ncbi:Sterol uptake control protein 2 [Beauveria bassiana]|uniref:Sterol uptake control protein 2 n=1 Tax=Beauveria bassiana TaxID=176275 RepID=A0A2N6NG84_BEABA|nr:Sterol uptake control protein 2 [Beauveria bassiana]
MQATSCARPLTNVVKRARRHHTKSRDGCQTCKARKVKCDEESSGCGNCVQFGVPCDFLPLLERKRWATTTATTATRRQQVTKRRRGRPRADWSGWALRAHDEALAPSSPLSSPSSSSSSSNQLQIRPSQPVPLHTQLNLQLAELAVDDLALLHHYHTVTALTLGDARLWRDAAPRLGREHPCIFHIMLSLSAYHLARLRPATTTSSASAAHCRRLADHHYEAAVRLAVPMLPRLDVGNCQALYVVTVLICFTAFARGPSSSGDLLLVAQQQGLVPWMSLLRGVRFVLETGQVHVVMAWAYTLDSDFVTKLAESDEISLVLLGHFAVLVQTLGRYWFIEGWGEHILREVRQILGEEWADLLPYEFYNARY